MSRSGPPMVAEEETGKILIISFFWVEIFELVNIYCRPVVTLIFSIYEKTVISI